MLMSWPAVRTRIPTALANFWRNQILQAQEQDVPHLLPEFLNLGDAGIGVLVELVGSPKASVSRPARKFLSDQTDIWLRLPKAEAQVHIATLAKALARHVESFGPSGRDYAEGLVKRMLIAKSGGVPLLSGSALPDCELVLQIIAEDHRRKWAERTARWDPDRGLPPVNENDPVETAPPVATARAPRGSDSAGSSNADVTMRPLAEANKAESIRLPSPKPAQDNAPDLLDLDTDSMRELPGMPTVRTPTKVRATRLEQPQAMQPVSVARGRQGITEEARISAWMQQLHDADPQIVHHAETHLTEVGFTKLHLELARQLTSQDPMVREQLAEALPRVPGIDAKTWLVWLSRDQRAEVRAAALSVMATINDPVLLKRIEEMARLDPDDRVRQQLHRLQAARPESRSGRRQQ
jgi:hypothetical protein